MMDSSGPQNLPPDTDAAVAQWMRDHGWDALPARWEPDPDVGFHVWQDEPSVGRPHALWISDAMVRHLAAGQLVQVLNSEDVAGEIRINFKVRIEERGSEYRISPVPRSSGEQRRQE